MQLFGKRALARYTALMLGLGAAGLAIGWIGHDLTAEAPMVTARR